MPIVPLQHPLFKSNFNFRQKNFNDNPPISGLGSFPGWPHLKIWKIQHYDTKKILNLLKTRWKWWWGPPLRKLLRRFKGVTDIFFLEIGDWVRELWLSKRTRIVKKFQLISSIYKFHQQHWRALAWLPVNFLGSHCIEGAAHPAVRWVCLEDRRAVHLLSKLAKLLDLFEGKFLWPC